jgi:ubiquinone/menaquinone biosynthesis C-methylase UbiE
MTSRDDRQLTRAYAHYSQSRRKQRNWSAKNLGNMAIRAELVDAVFALAREELGRAHDILDVGCGSGWWLQHLAGRPEVRAKLHGLELLPDRVEAAGQRVPNATINPGDARRLPYRDHSFGVVSLFTVLSSMPGRTDAELALQDAWRVLAPDGVLLVWEPRLPNPLNQHTTLIDRDLLRRATAGAKIDFRTTTVLPALARRLGARTEDLYPRLARIPAIRTHWLACARRRSVNAARNGALAASGTT